MKTTAELEEEVQRIVTPAVFSMSADALPQAEKRDVASIRFCMSGARTVRLFSTDQVRGYLASKKVDANPGQWLATATLNDLLGFCKAGNKIWGATLGVASLLYTPSGFLVAHRVIPGEDHTGLRVSVWWQDNGPFSKTVLYQQLSKVIKARSVPPPQVVPEASAGVRGSPGDAAADAAAEEAAIQYDGPFA